MSCPRNPTWPRKRPWAEKPIHATHWGSKSLKDEPPISKLTIFWNKTSPRPWFHVATCPATQNKKKSSKPRGSEYVSFLSVRWVCFKGAWQLQMSQKLENMRCQGVFLERKFLISASRCRSCRKPLILSMACAANRPLFHEVLQPARSVKPPKVEAIRSPKHQKRCPTFTPRQKWHLSGTRNGSRFDLGTSRLHPCPFRMSGVWKVGFRMFIGASQSSHGHVCTLVGRPFYPSPMSLDVPVLPFLKGASLSLFWVSLKVSPSSPSQRHQLPQKMLGSFRVRYSNGFALPTLWLKTQNKESTGTLRSPGTPKKSTTQNTKKKKKTMGHPQKKKKKKKKKKKTRRHERSIPSTLPQKIHL